MRLHILSDLHLEFGHATLPAANADVVVLAGDIHLGREGRKWIRKQFFDTPVVYVLGNHEFYRHAIPDLTETLKKETDGSHIHILENSVFEFNGFRFLGCTLWTDFQSAGNAQAAMREAGKAIPDFEMITVSNDRLLRPADTVELHRGSVAWLKGQLSNCDPAHTIIITHHAPSCRSIPPFYAGNILNAAFASNLDELVETAGIPLWVHGHTHYNVDYPLGSTRVLTNQRGYPDQLAFGFDPGLIVEL